MSTKTLNRVVHVGYGITKNRDLKPKAKKAWRGKKTYLPLSRHGSNHFKTYSIKYL